MAAGDGGDAVLFCIAVVAAVAAVAVVGEVAKAVNVGVAGSRWDTTEGTAEATEIEGYVEGGTDADT